MPVYIFQSDVLEKLAEVEGVEWRRELLTKSDVYNFAVLLAAWQAYDEAGCPAGWEPLDYLPANAEHVLYGAGGYSRYMLEENGELILLRETIREERIPLAEKAGFTIR